MNEKAFELKSVTLEEPPKTFVELEREVRSLNFYIGGYPPRFASEAERETIYEKWLSLVAEAEAFAKVNAGSEKSLYLLSELYRQGHNMDVKGSAEKTIENLDVCLANNNRSVLCNLSASYFYLSIGPKYLDKAERSLSILRQDFSPDLSEEVEAGYVFLYLFRQNVAMAREQIDSFIMNFPNSPRVSEFAKIKENLGESIELKYQ